MTVRSIDSRVDASLFQEQDGLIKEDLANDLKHSSLDLLQSGFDLIPSIFGRKQDSFALPLPRIPTPAGMIDLSKLPSILGTALSNGLKSFGSLGLGFARTVAAALGSAVQAVKNAGDGFGDVLKSDAQKIKSETGDFLRNSADTLEGIESGAGKLASSTNKTAKRIGTDAARFARSIREESGRLEQSLEDFAKASDQAAGSISNGAKLLGSGLVELLSGKPTGIVKIISGQKQIKQGLADAQAASEELSSASTRSLMAIEQSASRFAKNSEKAVGELSGDERRFAESILLGASDIAASATELKETVAEAAQNAAGSAGSLGASLDKTISTAWSKVAAAAEKLSRGISGTNQTTDEFLGNTKDFRNVAGRVRDGDKAAEAELKARWGYTAKTLPPAGTQFIDPNFLLGDLVKGQVTAGKFPTGQASNQPPDLEQQLFSNGRSITIPGDDGVVGATINNVTVRNLEEYQQVVSAQREAVLGIKNDSGKPVQVHAAFEGGGGQGKRYVPAVAEMYRLGVVPSSVSGTSVGAIIAGLVAAGADPSQLEALVRDERISKFIDLKSGGRGGFAEGQVAYQVFDETLRKITGIKDRPVTFADLKIPLHIVAAKYSDSAPPANQSDLTKRENRIFVFGPETTPNTPVALAMRASMAIPGVFDPVEMVDPTTGRTIQLTDGGSLDNLPIGYNRDGLPTVAVNLNEPNTNNPKSILNNLPELPLPGGQLFASNPLLNGLYGGLFIAAGGGLKDDYDERTKPPADTFVLSLPIWDLEKPQLADDGGTFPYDPKEDPRLDIQTRRVTDNFFRSFFDKLQTPGASGTNLKPLPADTRFTREFEYEGKSWTARYDGGHSVNFTADDGSKKTIFIGRNKLENWIIDDAAFGDLTARLRLALDGKLA